MSDRPNWSFWKHMFDAPLWQVIALSLDLSVDEDARDHPDFNSRLQIAINHVGANKLDVTSLSLTSPDLARVAFAEFRVWAESLEFALPAEFPGKAKPVLDVQQEVSEIDDVDRWNERAERLTREVDAERAKGTRAFAKAVALRMNISDSRLRELRVRKERPAEAATSVQQFFAAGRGRTPKKKPKG